MKATFGYIQAPQWTERSLQDRETSQPEHSLHQPLQQTQSPTNNYKMSVRQEVQTAVFDPRHYKVEHLNSFLRLSYKSQTY